jgi:hypothetical protein
MCEIYILVGSFAHYCASAAVNLIIIVNCVAVGELSNGCPLDSLSAVVHIIIGAFMMPKKHYILSV